MEQVAAGGHVLVLTGPTASGKTAIGVRIAELLGGEIISADSRQVFRGITIGTAKPAAAEIRGIPHHFIDYVALSDTYTAGTFAREATACIEDMMARGVQPVVVGGSGLYIQALIEGIFDGPEADPALRSELHREYHAHGIDPIWERLIEIDPESADIVPRTNIPRVIRALEVCMLTGEPYSKIRRERLVAPPFSAAVYGLEWNRSLLYRRINDRVEAMIQAGLVAEVRRIVSEGADPQWQSLKTVGYKEVFAYFDGTLKQEEMIAQIQQHTRNFAKRQLTWFRKKKGIIWVPVEEPFDVERIARHIVNNFRNSRAQAPNSAQ